MNSAKQVLAPDVTNLPYSISMLPDGAVIADKPSQILEAVPSDNEVVILGWNAFQTFFEYLPAFRDQGYRVILVWDPSLQPGFNTACLSYVSKEEDWVFRLVDSLAELVIQTGIETAAEVGITDSDQVEEHLRLAARQPIHLSSTSLEEISSRIAFLDQKLFTERVDLTVTKLAADELTLARRTVDELKASLKDREDENRSLRETNRALIRESLNAPRPGLASIMSSKAMREAGRANRFMKTSLRQKIGKLKR